jgi:hypothetical protein
MIKRFGKPMRVNMVRELLQIGLSLVILQAATLLNLFIGNLGKDEMWMRRSANSHMLQLTLFSDPS